MAIFTGETVEAAIERGLKRLGVSRENVHIQIEQREKRGFLGFGKKRARVNIEAIQEETVRKADRLAVRGVNEEGLGTPKVQSAMEATVELSQVVKAVRAAQAAADGELSESEKTAIIEQTKEALAAEKEVPSTSDEVSDSLSDQVDLAPEVAIISPEEANFRKQISQYLTLITQDMGVPASVSVDEKDGMLIFNLSSKEDALLIGKHGKILSSIQTLAQSYAHTITDFQAKISVNAGDYYEKRKIYLNSLARGAIERARQGEVVYLNDLQSNERKIIHATIARSHDVTSRSEGRDQSRHIVVEAKQYF